MTTKKCLGGHHDISADTSGISFAVECFYDGSTSLSDPASRRLQSTSVGCPFLSIYITGGSDEF